MDIAFLNSEATRNFKSLSQQPKQIKRLLSYVSDLSPEEIGLIADCTTNLAPMKKSKRIALWKAIKTFLED